VIVFRRSQNRLHAQKALMEYLLLDRVEAPDA
jgi:ornithine carbamoyltransferase